MASQRTCAIAPLKSLGYAISEKGFQYLLHENENYIDSVLTNGAKSCNVMTAVIGKVAKLITRAVRWISKAGGTRITTVRDFINSTRT